MSLKERRIYVAGGSTERLTVARPWIERIRADGWTLTHDWTHDAGYDGPRTFEQHEQSALLDFGGVARADVVWIIVPQDKSEGAGAEFGFARALRKHIVMSGRPLAGVFATQAMMRFGEHEQAFDYLHSLEPLPVGWV